MPSEAPAERQGGAERSPKSSSPNNHEIPQHQFQFGGNGQRNSQGSITLRDLSRPTTTRTPTPDANPFLVSQREQALRQQRHAEEEERKREEASRLHIGVLSRGDVAMPAPLPGKRSYGTGAVPLYSATAPRRRIVHNKTKSSIPSSSTCEAFVSSLTEAVACTTKKRTACSRRERKQADRIRPLQLQGGAAAGGILSLGKEKPAEVHLTAANHSKEIREAYRQIWEKKRQALLEGVEHLQRENEEARLRRERRCCTTSLSLRKLNGLCTGINGMRSPLQGPEVGKVVLPAVARPVEEEMMDPRHVIEYPMPAKRKIQKWMRILAQEETGGPKATARPQSKCRVREIAISGEPESTVKTERHSPTLSPPAKHPVVVHTVFLPEPLLTAVVASLVIAVRYTPPRVALYRRPCTPPLGTSIKWSLERAIMNRAIKAVDGQLQHQSFVHMMEDSLIPPQYHEAIKKRAPLANGYDLLRDSAKNAKPVSSSLCRATGLLEYYPTANDAVTELALPPSYYDPAPHDVTGNQNTCCHGLLTRKEMYLLDSIFKRKRRMTPPGTPPRAQSEPLPCERSISPTPLPAPSRFPQIH